MQSKFAGREVYYREWTRVPDEKRRSDQSKLAYDWSDEEYPGIFVEFAHYSDDDMESEAVIMRSDGTVVIVQYEGFRFVVTSTETNLFAVMSERTPGSGYETV